MTMRKGEGEEAVAMLKLGDNRRLCLGFGQVRFSAGAAGAPDPSAELPAGAPLLLPVRVVLE